MGIFDMFTGAGVADVNFKQLVADGATIIDVRTPQEFNEGHIQGAINIPVHEIGNSIPKIKELSSPIITYCLSGGRSGTAISKLTRSDLEAYNGGGINQLHQALVS